MQKKYKSKKIEGNIICSCISDDAKIIAISYDKIIVIFKYDFEQNEVKKIGTIKYQAILFLLIENIRLSFYHKKKINYL